MDQNLSQIIADLFAKSPGGEEVSSKIARLREEILKVIDSEDTIFGKLRMLLESLKEVIPDEKQRYHAAIKALATTSRTSQQEIMNALNTQLAELKILEKDLIPALPSWRDELKAMEARAQGLRTEIARLREQITQLEKEEKGIMGSMAGREKEMMLVEKALKDFFTGVAGDVIAIRKRLEEFTAEAAPAAPAPQAAPAAPAPQAAPVAPAPQAAPVAPAPQTAPVAPAPQAAPVAPAPQTAPVTPPPQAAPQVQNPPDADREVTTQAGAISEPSPAPRVAEQSRPCPMCGGRMGFHEREHKWRCSTCAYEEQKQHEEWAGVGIADVSDAQAAQDTTSQKKCSVCGGRMDFYANGNFWKCYSCAHEESSPGDAPGSETEQPAANTPEPQPDPDFAVALTDSIPTEERERHKEPTKKKTCPVCRKKMSWHRDEKVWLCPFCEYERRVL